MKHTIHSKLIEIIFYSIVYIMIQENNYVQANKSSNQEEENHIQQPVQKEENIVESFMNTIQEAIQEPISIMEEAFGRTARQRATGVGAIVGYVLGGLFLLFLVWYIPTARANGSLDIRTWTTYNPLASPVTTGVPAKTDASGTGVPAKTDASGTGVSEAAVKGGGFSINDISVTTAHM
jgi:hypothetical protein